MTTSFLLVMHLRKDWFYLDWRKYLYIDISNPKKTMNKLKMVFKPLKCYFRFTKGWDHYPVLWCSKPAHIQIMAHDVWWKDKYNTPRYEVPPYVWIHLFKYNLIWYWSLPPHQQGREDQYWEQALWYLYYYNTVSYGLLDSPNIEKARETWEWTDCETNKSTWTDEFLIK